MDKEKSLIAFTKRRAQRDLIIEIKLLIRNGANIDELTRYLDGEIIRLNQENAIHHAQLEATRTKAA